MATNLYVFKDESFRGVNADYITSWEYHPMAPTKTPGPRPRPALPRAASPPAAPTAETPPAETVQVHENDAEQGACMRLWLVGRDPVEFYGEEAVMLLKHFQASGSALS